MTNSIYVSFCGVLAVVAYQTHYLVVGGSIPPPATNNNERSIVDKKIYTLRELTTFMENLYGSSEEDDNVIEQIIEQLWRLEELER